MTNTMQAKHYFGERKGEGAKLATVNFQMDNFGTRKLDGAKPYIIN